MLIRRAAKKIDCNQFDAGMGEVPPRLVDYHLLLSSRRIWGPRMEHRVWIVAWGLLRCRPQCQDKGEKQSGGLHYTAPLPRCSLVRTRTVTPDQAWIVKGNDLIAPRYPSPPPLFLADVPPPTSSLGWIYPSC